MFLFLIQYQIPIVEKHSEWESNVYNIDLIIGPTGGQWKRIEYKPLDEWFTDGSGMALDKPMLNEVSDGLHMVPFLEISKNNLAIGDFGLHLLVAFWDRVLLCVPTDPKFFL